MRTNTMLLSEGLNVKDVCMDVVQVGLDSGAIALSGGMGGDTLVDALFASSEAAEILKLVKDVWGEMKVVGSIIKDVATFDMTQGLDKFFKMIQNSVHLAVKNGLIGEDVVKFLEDVQKEVDTLINKIVRAISKWVGALVPDDFGLGGPSFEATVTTAIKTATQKPFDLVAMGVSALPQTAQDLLLDANALTTFLQDCVGQLIDWVGEIQYSIDNPDPEKAGLLNMMASNIKFQSELMMAPITGVANMVASARGDDAYFDTIGEDLLDNLESLPSWHPSRKLLSVSLPPVVRFLDKVESQYCDEAAETLSFLMKVLFGCLGVLQLALDPEAMKKMKKMKQKEFDDIFGFDEMEIELTPEDLAMEVAMKSSIHKWKLKQLLG